MVASCIWVAAGASTYKWTEIERTLAIFERALGSEHPNTRTVRGNLAALDGYTGGGRDGGEGREAG